MLIVFSVLTRNRLIICFYFSILFFYFWASFNDYNHRGIQLPLHSVSIMWETACSLSASDRTYCLSFILVTFMSLLEF
jgi:hypothetical protein